jgi:hypothetical protein
MAKRSAADLSVVPIKPKDARLTPPRFLTDRQKELWREVAAAKPADWFTDDCKALLVGYVKAIASHEFLSSRIDLIESGTVTDDMGDQDRLYSMVERQARLIQSFATKMRLTNQSRYQNSTASAKSARAGQKRPWD